MRQFTKITEWYHHFVELQVQPGDFCIDATMGNGYDTELLCRLTGEKGQVLAFDIQEKALQSTEKKLRESGVPDNYRLILDSHSHMDQYADADSVSCIIFNFGYLPGGSHALATSPSTSIPAIEQGLTLLKKGGLMSLCIYSGGDSGFEERDAILAFLKELDSGKYLVILSSYYNRPKNPPIPVLIRKL
ncbi:MAG: 16S rRNA (cytosine(1402)-N(4))-methyltransferase [Clostridiales bacterium]|nr:16S rRNA (cytosine(1402)-N(4))-methyltransferase [Clostridiales bacterium]